MKDYTLPIAFLLAPFLILSTGYIWTGQQIGLMVIFLVIMAAMIENLWIRAFLFYAIAWQTVLFIQALIHPKMFEAAIASGYTQCLFMVAGAMIYLTASRSKIKDETFYNVICAAALIQTVVALFQRFAGIDLVLMGLSLIAPTKSSMGDNALVGFLGNPNYLAAFLAFSVPFFFRRYWALTLPLVIIVLVVSMTSSAVLPVIIGIGVFVAMKYKLGWKWLTPVSMAVFLLIAGYEFYDPMLGNPRFEMWGPALNQVIQAPVGLTFGLGPGAAWANNYLLHSEWVTLFHQFGVVGLALAAGFLWTVKRNNIFLFSSFVVIVINMFGNAALHIAPTAFLACMVAGLMERKTENG
jgi:hypothetical protein